VPKLINKPKIEYVRSNGNVFAEIQIDGKKVPSKCRKYADKANVLEAALNKLYSSLPDGYENECIPEIKQLIHRKFISEDETVEIIGSRIILEVLILNGELDYSEDGSNRLFDISDVNYIKENLLYP